MKKAILKLRVWTKSAEEYNKAITDVLALLGGKE
jgi:hypothetical protein